MNHHHEFDGQGLCECGVALSAQPVLEWTPQDAADLALGRRVRALVESGREPEFAKARGLATAYRVSYFTTMGTSRVWRSLNRRTLDSAVEAAAEGG